MPSWPDVEKAVVAWLTTLGVPVYTETGPTTPAEYILVERVGGAGRRIDKDISIEVAVIAASRPAMWALASSVEMRMRELAAAGAPYIDDVDEQFSFAFDPYPNVAARRATATYTLTVRPQ